MRKARSLTQEDFALVSSRTHLSSLERGKKSPTLDKVAALAGILGVHPLTLLTLTCSYYDNNNDLDVLFAHVKRELTTQEAIYPTMRVLITDDHAIVRQGLKQFFALVDDIEVAAEATNGDEALERLADNDIDLLLLDLSMPGLSGDELISTIRREHPGVPILVFSMHAEPQIARRALDAGARGFMSKDHDPETLLAAMRAVAAGGDFMDPRLRDELHR
jgi:CheY-like chemotaxis protein/DNA-binding XRE family transcriptional regulator